MKPDQERMHTVLTDTISLLCRNGLNYEKELKVQGVIGVTVDNKEVFIVHINETFDCREETSEPETADVSPGESTPAIRSSKVTRRLNQRNSWTDYSRTTSSAHRRMARMKARHTYRMPGFSQASTSVKSPENLSNAPVLESPMLPYILPGVQDDAQCSSDRNVNRESSERSGGGDVRSGDERQSRAIVVKEDDDDESEEHDEDVTKTMPVKEDDNDENVQHYNSITSSLQDDSNDDARQSETEQSCVVIDEQRIKVESDSFGVETAATPACNEFSAFGLASSLPPSSSSFLPDSRDSHHSFTVDLKTECYERRMSTGLLSMEGGREGLSLPLHSKQLMSAISPGQALMAQRRSYPSQPYDIMSSRNSAIPAGFSPVSPSQSTDGSQGMWRMMARFICEFPGCNTSFSNKQNLLRHQTHKHGRQKIPRQSRAVANYYAANITANLSLPNFMDSSEG